MYNEGRSDLQSVRQRSRMATADYKATESLVQNSLLECRRLFTRSVTDIPKYSTLQKIREDYPGFMRECFKAHKVALGILIDGVLHLESLIAQADVANAFNSRSIEAVKLVYWKRLLELSYNTLVWLSVGLDRSNVGKIFKGPKYGDVAHQNIQSVLMYVNELNEDPNVIAVPLDFCSFSPICDVVKLSYFESDKTLEVTCIELKSGKVNAEMLETITSGTMNAYFKFFDTYGKKGIKQIERFFRQQTRLEKSQKLINARPGVYENPANPKENLVILANEVQIQDFSDKVANSLEKAEQKEFAVDEVDDCLIIGAINAEDENMTMLGEFDLRLYVYHSFIGPSTLDRAPYPKDLHVILDTINLIDWREGFNSVILIPILMRNIPDQYLMDLLFGRKILKLFLDPQAFVDLCNYNGIKADLTTTKEAKRLKSSGHKGYVDFAGQFIRLSPGDSSQIFDEGPFLGEGILHEMLFNWVHPKSVIEQMKQFSFPKQR
jgi:hypothetical protein